jgi:hypothetical protein
MKRILPFHQFDPILEALDLDAVDPVLLKALRGLIGDRPINVWIQTPEFGSLSSPRSNAGGGPIFFEWNGEEMRLPGVIFRNGVLYSDQNPQEESSWKNGKGDAWDRITNLLDQSQKGVKEFNVFDAGVESMPIVRDMMKRGMEIVSTDRQRKNGTLALRFPQSQFNYSLTPNGYIRRQGVSGFLSTKPELIRPIHSLEDLIPKITYVYFVHLKDIGKSLGISRKDLNPIEKTMGTSEYPDVWREITQKFPSMAVYLPAPEGSEGDEIVKGARVLGRMGIF